MSQHEIRRLGIAVLHALTNAVNIIQQRYGGIFLTDEAVILFGNYRISVSQVIVSHHKISPAAKELCEFLIPQDMLHHAMDQLHDPLRSFLHLIIIPGNTVDLRSSVRRRKCKVFSYYRVFCHIAPPFDHDFFCS